MKYAILYMVGDYVNGTIYIQIISLIYSFMLMIVYFSKKRLNTPENKVY